MKKLFKFLLTAICLVSVFTLQAHAATLGTIGYWYNEENDNVSRIKLDGNRPPNLFTIREPTGYNKAYTAGQVKTYMDWAYFQWANNGFGSTQYYDIDNQYADVKKDILVCFGSSEYLFEAFGSQPESVKGITKRYGLEYEGTWKYNKYGVLVDKNGYKNTISVIGIIKEHNNQTEKSVATHELGHAYGWMGHSGYISDVMCPSILFIEHLTFADSMQVTQIKTY